MPTVTTVQPYLPVKESLVSPQTGALTPVGLQWFQQQAGNISAMASSLNTVPGVNLFTVATQPSPGAGDVGFVGILTDLNHFVVWDGSAWQPLDGGAGYFAMRPVAPSGSGWQLCDGTATTYLTYGATLTLTAFTTPDLISTAAYLKSIGSYTGTINAKVAPSSTGTGTTGTGTTGTGTTGSSTDTFTTGQGAQSLIMGAGANLTVTAAHTHSGTTDGHTHTVPGLSVPGLSVPGLSIGTIEMANLGSLVYFRR